MDKQPGSRMCFICGRQNPAGLKLNIYSDRERGEVRSEVVISDNYQGYPGVVHGGIVAAMLDEVAGRSMLLEGDEDNLMVTLKLEVRYRRPTPTDTPLLVVGSLVQPGERRARAHGEIRLPDGTVSAEADVLLARPPQSITETWETEKQYWRVYE
ncbi:MAG: PaaI family thioesterase [Thermoflexales bacterium]|nr:PaaI family thioesterase [Thermoflexales bacterium]